MINVNQITAQLSRLPDAALQQYAAMHKNDPYTMALASAESNRRKQMRSGAQGAAQQQPTVADQEISNMNAAPQPQATPMPPQAQGQLPEDQGIGALPTPNMQGMADGGIVGYAGGGSPSAQDAAIQNEYNKQLQSGLYNTAAEAWEATKGLFGFKPGWQERLKATPLEDKGGMTPYATPKRTGIFEYEPAAAAVAREQPPTPMATQGFGTNIVPQAAPGATVAAIPQAPYVDPRTQVTDGRPLADRKPPATREAPPAKEAPTIAAKPTGLETLEGAYSRVSAIGDREAKQGIADYQKEVDSTITALKKSREEGKPAGEAYAEYRASLEKDAAAAQGKEDKNLKMAIVNAGLAMMGGKSQYALQNIAEGAQVGTKQYQTGLDKLEEAAKARQKEIAMIEQARRAESRGDWKDESDFNQRAADAKLASKKYGIEGLASITGATRKEAGVLYNKNLELAQEERKLAFDAQKHRESLANQLKVAGIYAAPRAASGAITPALALKEYNDLVARDVSGDFQMRYPNAQAYMAAQGVIGGAPAAAAPVDTTGYVVRGPKK